MLLETSHLTKRFGPLAALDNVSLRFAPGQSVALIGPNGSGKTTFIKTVLGMVVPTAGEVFFDGKNIAGQHAYRARVGYMPQIGRYPDNMTVGQLFQMMRDLRPDARDTDEELVETFALKNLLEKTLPALSGGTRQKVGAALAFLFRPDVLILDEPTAGLDPLSAEVLKTKIRQFLREEKLVLITSHILSDLEEIATDVVYMQDGKVLFESRLEALKAQTGEAKLGKAIAKVLGQKLNGRAAHPDLTTFQKLSNLAPAVALPIVQ